MGTKLVIKKKIGAARNKGIVRELLESGENFRNYTRSTTKEFFYLLKNITKQISKSNKKLGSAYQLL